jgi:hypothetical protein
LPNPGTNAIFTPHDGEIMDSPGVFIVYWGLEYSAPPFPTVGARLTEFVQQLLSSRYVGLLAEYGVGSASFLNEYGDAYAGGSVISRSDLVNQLTSWMDLGILPIPANDETNLLFLVFTPRGVGLSLPGIPPGSFCGYHSSDYHAKIFGKANLFFAVVSWSDSMDDMTESASHELAEAFTDRSDDRGWFSDADGNEISDECNFCGGPSLQLGNFAVASYWRNSVGHCLQQWDLTPGPIAVPDLTNMDLTEAMTTLSNNGLTMTSRLVGVWDLPGTEVVGQWPAPTTMVDAGTPVEVDYLRYATIREH